MPINEAFAYALRHCSDELPDANRIQATQDAFNALTGQQLTTVEAGGQS